MCCCLCFFVLETDPKTSTLAFDFQMRLAAHLNKGVTRMLFKMVFCYFQFFTTPALITLGITLYNNVLYGHFAYKSQPYQTLPTFIKAIFFFNYKKKHQHIQHSAKCFFFYPLLSLAFLLERENPKATRRGNTLIYRELGIYG